MNPNFLFRRPIDGHTFMTTQDPTYVYNVLCGHCGYPIEADDEVCPRCQLELEDCPVCRESKHMRARKISGDALTGKTCPVCQTNRVPFGGTPITEIEGSFCRNLYGCRAGGLLLREEEFAVLRPHASGCPICHHEELTPLDVRTFLYHVSRCLFCHSVFGPLPAWTKGWSEDWDPAVGDLRPTGPRDASPCILCGRRDELVSAAGDGVVKVAQQTPYDEPGTEEISGRHYLRVVELGRILVLEQDPGRAFQRLFDSWFEPNRTELPDTVVPVERIGELLLQGTVVPSIQRILRGRVEETLRAWGHRLPSGLSYAVAARDGRKRKRG